MGSTQGSSHIDCDEFSVKTISYETYSYHWTLTNFEDIIKTQDYVDSPIFFADTEHQWYIRLATNTTNENDVINDTLDLHLCIKELGKISNPQTGILTKFEFHLLGENGESIGRIGTKLMDAVDMSKELSWGADKALTRTLLIEKGITKELKLRCDIMIQKDVLSDRHYRCSKEVETASRLEVCQDFKKFLNKPELSDVTLNVGSGRKLLAHKIILSARSPVFAEIFKKDNSLDEINIDSDEAAVKQFLTHIYCGELDIKNGNLVALIKLADEYNMKGLMKTCIDTIPDTVTVETVIDTLVAVEKYPQLKTSMFSYIKKNIKQVKSTASFQKLGVEKPNLVMEIIQLCF